MSPAALNAIKEQCALALECANGIMAGEHDNYDGADGAREVIAVCHMIKELINEIETME
jgi:hypothetical protein